MTPKRVTIILSASLAALLLGMVGGTYVFAGNLKKQSSQLASDKAEVAALTSQQASLVKSKQDVSKYSSLETIAKSVVPQDKDQAATIREIINIADTNNVSLTTITFPSSTLGAGSAKTTSGTAVAATNARPDLSQLAPVKGLPGVYNLQINLGNNTANPVTYQQLVNFLKGLENNRRTAAVSNISIQPQTSKPSDIVFSLVINTYIKP